MECEIFGTLVEEAKDSYDESIVFELQSDTAEEMEANVDRLVTFVNQWRTGPNTSGDTMMTVN